MKYLIASDIHGSAYWTERLVAAIESEQPDRIVLLGDLLYHGPRNDLPRDYAPKRVIPLLNALADRIIAVRRRYPHFGPKKIKGRLEDETRHASPSRASAIESTCSRKSARAARKASALAGLFAGSSAVAWFASLPSSSGTSAP